MRGRGYIVSPRRALVPTRDLERLRKRGWVVTPDYELDDVDVVFEVGKGLQPRVLGLVTNRNLARSVIDRVDTDKARKNRLVRVNDLMDIKRMAWRTGRAKSTIVGTWFKWDDWPQHVAEFGGSKVWFWPDVHACLERHGVRVRKEVANGDATENVEHDPQV